MKADLLLIVVDLGKEEILEQLEGVPEKLELRSLSFTLLLRRLDPLSDAWKLKR